MMMIITIANQIVTIITNIVKPTVIWTMKMRIMMITVTARIIVLPAMVTVTLVVIASITKTATTVAITQTIHIAAKTVTRNLITIVPNQTATMHQTRQ